VRGGKGVSQGGKALQDAINSQAGAGRQPAPARPGGATSRRSTWCRVSRALAETVRRIQPEPGCEIYPA